MALLLSNKLDSIDCLNTPASFFLGLHLSGSNSQRTAAVILNLDKTQKIPEIGGVYEKIGSIGSIFSDERLLTIIVNTDLEREIFTDVPLSLPPCGLCERPVCPGVIECHDLAVAYMLKLSQSNRTLKKGRKKRPINPQSQRLWDVAHLDDDRFRGIDLSYNSGKSSPNIRIKAFKKRLLALQKQHELLETSVPHVLAVLASNFGLSKESCLNYRCFENGSLHREKIFAELVARSWIKPSTGELEERISHSVDVFHAFICSLVNTFYHQKMLTKPPDEVYTSQGWIYLPHIDAIPQYSG
ncbi:MAG: hypothetical protein AB8G05_00110 [Oligoflexales bacterium]